MKQKKHLFTSVFLLLICIGSYLKAQQVSTLAGHPISSDGTGTNASFYYATGVAADASGNIFVADRGNNKIRKITPAGVVTTIAGTGASGSADGPGSTATFNLPEGIAVDASGNLYVADYNNNKIRMINTAGVVSTIAGSGTFGSADGTGVTASFSYPRGIAVDGSGNLFVTDNGSHKIRMITSAGVVTTFAGSGSVGKVNANGTAASFNRPAGIVIDASGNLYIADQFNHLIRKITPAADVTTFAGYTSQGAFDGTGTSAAFNSPWGITMDASGNLYVADQNNQKIRKITPAAVVTTLAGSSGVLGNVDATGTAARFRSPAGITADISGNLYLADAGNNKIRKINSAGVVTTFAGSRDLDATGTAASFFGPYNVATDVSGNVYVAEIYNHKIRKITPAGVVTTLAGSGDAGYVDGTGTAASFNGPRGIAVDASGNVFVSDYNNIRIRKITPAGVVTTFAGNGTPIRVDGTGTAASFEAPGSLEFDAAGNLYVTDYRVIRKITPAGVVSTFVGSGTSGNTDGIGTAASLSGPNGMAFDASGNLYIVDQNNNNIRKVTPAGVTSTLAGTGGSGYSDVSPVQFNTPSDVTIGIDGNLYVTDNGNRRIRRVTPTGMTSTVAGSGTFGNSDGVGLNASFGTIGAITTDPSGNIYIIDVGNHSIRKLVLIPEIKIAQGTSELVSGSGNYDFSNVQQSTSTVGITFTISNTGNSTLNFSSSPVVEISGTNAADFTLTAAGIPSTLAAGSTATFTISFTPSAMGIRTATITVISDDLDEGTYTFTVSGTGKLAQTISGISDFSKTFGDAPFNLSATTSSGLAVSYTSSNTSIATISGNTVTILTAGSFIITAAQPGDVTYLSAPNVVVNVTVAKATRTATITSSVNGLVGDVIALTNTLSIGTGTAVWSMSPATGSASLNGTNLTLLSSGTLLIQVSYAEDANYLSCSSPVQVFTISAPTSVEGSKQGSLLTVYPNPFEASSTIYFQVPNSDFVTLEVFNLLGNRIKTIVENRFLSVGEYTMILGDFPEGSYTLRLQIGSIAQNIPIIKF